MSVIAECFRVDIGVGNQITFNSREKSDDDIIQKFLDNLKLESEKLIESTPNKDANNNFVEVISVDSESIFGIIGKSNKVEESVMRKVRNKEGKTITSTDFNMEDYRFFVMHLPTLRCAVIKNSDAPAFQTLFNSFLNNYKTMRINRISVIPVRDENIEKKFKRFRRIAKIDMIFAKDSSLQRQIVSLEDTFDISETSMIKSSVALTLKNQKVSSRIRKFIAKRDLIEYEFEKLEITGGPHGDAEETLEFVKRFLTLNVDIEIDYDYLIFSEEYFEKIKKALLESLNAY